MMSKHECAKSRLCCVSFGFALGVIAALGALILALIGAFSDYGHLMIQVLGTVYKGYSPTFVGGIIGIFWGLVDGFVTGFLFAWLYNKCILCCWKCKEKCMQ